MEHSNLQRRLEASFRESLTCGHELLAEVGKLENDREVLLKNLVKVADWLEDLKNQSKRGAETCAFLSLKDAYIADAKNYEATEKSVRAAISSAEAPSTTQGGE